MAACSKAVVSMQWVNTLLAMRYTIPASVTACLATEQAVSKIQVIIAVVAWASKRGEDISRRHMAPSATSVPSGLQTERPGDQNT